MSRNSTFASILLYIIAGWGIFATAVVVFLVYRGETDPDKRAILGMGVSLILIWCVAGGIAMRLGRDRLAGLARKLKIDWRVRFVLLCIAMAMLEEAVTTSLTNAAPLFGAVTDAARITASKNTLRSSCVTALLPLFRCSSAGPGCCIATTSRRWKSCSCSALTARSPRPCRLACRTCWGLGCGCMFMA